MGSMFSKPKAPSMPAAPAVAPAPPAPTASSAPLISSSKTEGNITKDPMQDRRRRGPTTPTSSLLGDTSNPSILGE